MYDIEQYKNITEENEVNTKNHKKINPPRIIWLRLKVFGHRCRLISKPNDILLLLNSLRRTLMLI